MQDLSISLPKTVVKQARLFLGETQSKFAKRVDSTQPLISRYEDGSVDPPADLIMHCIHILGVPTSSLVSEFELIKLVKHRLSGDRMAAARMALAQLICTLPMEPNMSKQGGKRSR